LTTKALAQRPREEDDPQSADTVSAWEEDDAKSLSSYTESGATLLALLFAVLLASTAQADEPRLSISGYDPVAYFADGSSSVSITEECTHAR
jgi:hypothetical protein